MKNLIFLSAVFFISFGSIAAQNIPGVPNGSVGKDSRDEYDNGIRIRSIELERVKKESYRSAAAEKSAENRRINYSEIEKDFELIQKLQNEIVKTYVTGKEINYKRIGDLASKLNECAGRLDGNLSLSTIKSSEKSNKKSSKPEDVRDIIIVLDKTIGKFVVNPVFTNLDVFEAKNAEKAEFDLQSIIQLSNFLAQKSLKQK